LHVNVGLNVQHTTPCVNTTMETYKLQSRRLCKPTDSGINEFYVI